MLGGVTSVERKIENWKTEKVLLFFLRAQTQ
jgi:hypothetical protein